VRGKNIIWLSLVAVLLTSTMVGIAPAPTTTRMYVDPSAIVDPTKVVGSVFAVTVNVADVSNLYGWSFKLFFNPSIVQATGIVLPSPSFLRSAGPTMVLSKKYDNIAGYAYVSEVLRIPYPPSGASGSGIFATISFQVVGVGVTTLDLQETKLNTVIAGNTVPMPHLAEDGLFDNRIANQPPVAIFSVTPAIGTVGTPFKFDASASHDDAWIASYFWDLGDGTNATSKVIEKTWNPGTEGTYTVTLTVTDNDGVSDSAQYALTVYAWMQAGDHPDLIKTLIWPEYPVFKEADFGEHETLWAKVGNPTDESYQVRVAFDIYSKDEGLKLGTISTAVETVLPHEEKDISADFFLGDSRWKTTTGPYNWPYWVKKYWAIGRCFYLNESTMEWKAGIFPGANQFKIHPVVHDRAIIAMSANASGSDPAHVGDLVEIIITLENQGEQIEHDVPLTLRVFKVGPIGTATTTLTIGQSETFTFYWEITAGLEPGNYVIIAEVGQHPYEKDIIDNSMYIVVAVS